jgi:hypothetical protein
MSDDMLDVWKRGADGRPAVYFHDSARREYVEAQARADRVLRQFGDSAERWQDGESIADYRRRLLEPLKQHSPAWRKVDVPRQEDVLAVAEKQILADAAREAVAPTNLKPGQLVERVTTDPTGRKISRFYGDPEAVWGMFRGETKIVTGFGGAGK